MKFFYERFTGGRGNRRNKILPCKMTALHSNKSPTKGGHTRDDVATVSTSVSARSPRSPVPDRYRTDDRPADTLSAEDRRPESRWATRPETFGMQIARCHRQKPRRRQRRLTICNYVQREQAAIPCPPFWASSTSCGTEKFL